MRALGLCFGAMLVVMVGVTAWASLSQPLFGGGGVHAEVRRQFRESPWAVATLVDAYCGFLAFYAWIAYRETTWRARALWLVLVLGLGNMATAGYVLYRLARRRPGDGVAQLLLRPAAAR